MTSLSHVSGLMERLNRFRGSRQAEQFETVQEFLPRLRQRLPEFLAEDSRIEFETSPRFNVFRILRLAHREVQTHTPFLGELLNPKGTHGQHFTFLKHFFAVAQSFGLRVPAGSVEAERWHVDTEYPTAGFGNMDIVVRCSALRFLLVIENKIWAGEQPTQLARYIEWMKAQAAYDVRQLIFLTPRGHASQTAGQEGYIRLSYQIHIKQWLHVALPDVQSPAVRETMRQYLQLVEAF